MKEKEEHNAPHSRKEKGGGVTNTCKKHTDFLEINK